MIKIAKILFLSLSFISLSTYADNKLNAPLGLAWGIDAKKITTDFSAKEIFEPSGKFRFSDAERVRLFEIKKRHCLCQGLTRLTDWWIKNMDCSQCIWLNLLLMMILV